jgi:hypothetical protein
VISGLHGDHAHFFEHDLLETGFALAGYRFREVAVFESLDATA